MNGDDLSYFVGVVVVQSHLIALLNGRSVCSFFFARTKGIYFDSELGVSVRLMLPSSFFIVFRNPNERIRAIKIHIDQLEMNKKKCHTY